MRGCIGSLALQNTLRQPRLLHTAPASNTHAVRLAYDALGRLTSEGSDHYGAKTFQYDLAGRRTRMTWRDGFYVDYDHLVTGEVSAIRENGATSGVGVLGAYAYDDRGRRTSLTRGNGTVTSYAFDNVDRLTQLVQNLNGISSDLTLDFTYNPASGIVTNTRSNDAFAFTLHYANRLWNDMCFRRCLLLRWSSYWRNSGIPSV